MSENSKEVKQSTEAHLGISVVTNCPDWTIVWNTIDYLKGRSFITDTTKQEVWDALTKVEKEKRCTLAPFPDDVY
jgi:hypothetical protein